MKTLKIIVCLVLLIMMSASVASSQNAHSQLFIPMSFGYRAGTSTQLSSVLDDCYTENRIIDFSQNAFLLEDILASSKKRLHFQRKLLDFEVACIFVDSNNKHHNLLIYDNMIIDLSFAKEYHIKKDKPKEELNSFLKAYKERCESNKDSCNASSMN